VTERHAKGSNVSSSPPKHQQNIPTPLENDCICSFDKQANNIYKSVCKRVPCQAKNKQEQKTDARSIRHSPTDRVTCLFYIECAAGVVLLLSIQSMFCQSSFSFSLHGGQILRFGRGFFKSTHKQNTLLLSLSPLPYFRNPPCAPRLQHRIEPLLPDQTCVFSFLYQQLAQKRSACVRESMVIVGTKESNTNQS
jgi:hypothetical protein